MIKRDTRSPIVIDAQNVTVYGRVVVPDKARNSVAVVSCANEWTIAGLFVTSFKSFSGGNGKNLFKWERFPFLAIQAWNFFLF